MEVLQQRGYDVLNGDERDIRRSCAAAVISADEDDCGFHTHVYGGFTIDRVDFSNKYDFKHEL